MPLLLNYHDIISCLSWFSPKEWNVLLFSSCTPPPSFNIGGCSNTQLLRWCQLVMAWVSRLLHCQPFCQLEHTHHGNYCTLLQVSFERQLLNIYQQHTTAMTVSLMKLTSRSNACGHGDAQPCPHGGYERAGGARVFHCPPCCSFWLPTNGLLCFFWCVYDSALPNMPLKTLF